MTEQQLLQALNVGEARDWEFKSARGGLPGSLWETYSAMANTDGGIIVLGVDEKDGSCFVSGLPDPARIQKDFWNNVNNQGKISVNLLTDDMVTTVTLGEKTALAIHVPRASRRQRPVYVGPNPLAGTFRRNYEGDYHCSPEEVGRMLADRAEEPADSRVLPQFALDDLDPVSLKQYRQLFTTRAPDHPWLVLETQAFLEKLGGWRRDRNTGVEGLTVAGLLMFGKDEAIRDPAALPRYYVDYRERLSDVPEIRWTDRLIPDGTWTANLFQFYQRVILRLTRDLKVPFRLEPDLFRIDDTLVHEAMREALTNAIIHADYQGMGGIVIERYRNRIELSNPGSLLISYEQLLRGGVSECRNRCLQQMFQMIGRGEKAGSGIDKIRQGWNSQSWRSPEIEEIFQPDRVLMILPLESFLPEASLDRLRAMFGRRFDSLGPMETQTLVTAEAEGGVSNARMRMVSNEHAADLTRMFQGLVLRGFLEQVGQKRGAFYRLPRIMVTIHKADSPHNVVENFPHKADSPHKEPEDSPHKVHTGTTEEDAMLMQIAAPARSSQRLPPVQTRRIILDLCANRFLTPAQIGALMDRKADRLQERFLAPMAREGLLQMRFPQERNRPDQAYTTRTV